MIDIAIAKLADYAAHTGLIDPCERTWAVNTILDVLKLDSYTEPERTWNPADVALAPVLEELAAMADCLAKGTDLRESELTAKHADWAEAFAKNYTITADNALDIVKKETGLVFAQVLEHAGVYKRTVEGKTAFLRFLHSCCGSFNGI